MTQSRLPAGLTMRSSVTIKIAKQINELSNRMNERDQQRQSQTKHMYDLMSIILT